VNGTTVAFVQSAANNAPVITLGATPAGGWAATITSPALLAGTDVPATCGVFVGNGAPPNPAVTNEGAPGCW
jgi:hypothetical protein